MATIVKMPKMGSIMTEGTVAKWLISEGESVEEGDALLEVQTSKLTNEVEAEASGILRKILVEEGVTVPCQEPIAIIAEEDEDISNVL